MPVCFFDETSYPLCLHIFVRNSLTFKSRMRYKINIRRFVVTILTFNPHFAQMYARTRKQGCDRSFSRVFTVARTGDQTEVNAFKLNAARNTTKLRTSAYAESPFPVPAAVCILPHSQQPSGRPQRTRRRYNKSVNNQHYQHAVTPPTVASSELQ